MMKKLLLVFVVVQCLLIMVSCDQLNQEIYVSINGNDANDGTVESPLKSIDFAIQKAKQIKGENSKTFVTIHIAEGEYYLSEPIQVSNELSYLELKGAGSNETFIKGSQILKLNWNKYNNHIWETTIADTIELDQLFINGEQQILARYPNYNEEGGHWQGHAADVISPERIATWKNPRGGFIHAMHSGEWGGFHFKIADIDMNGDLDLDGGHQNNRPSEMHDKFRMVENIFEELDSPGEWYFDPYFSKLYFWPEEGLDINNALAEGVQLKHLIEIVGTEETPVVGVTVSGINFQHTKRTFMEPYEQLLRSDWTIYRGGAVFLEGTEKVRINNCEFSNLGGNVIFVSKYNREVQITGNHIHDSGASAISFVGDPGAVRSPSFQYGEFVPISEMDTLKGPANNAYPSKAVVDNNLIYRIGRTEKQTAGIQLSMAMNITISNNSIYEVPRAGINVSEGTWGGHIIEYNDVFRTVLETSDHGAFNSWGRDRFWHPKRDVMNDITTNNPEMPYWDAIHTTIIRNNRFRCDHGWDIDLDDGSSNYEIYNNVTLKGGIKLREGFYRTVENNIMVNNSFHPHVWFENSGDVFRSNIVMTKYRDIRLDGWGKEMDYNLFPSEAALIAAQKNETDLNSLFGNPQFLDAENGDYTVAENSPALKLGFKNFPMHDFGVKKPELKAIAKQPELPIIWSIEDAAEQQALYLNWLGGEIKNIESLEERSASGLNKTAGVLITKVSESGILFKSHLKVGDVIIEAEGKEVSKIPDLMSIYEGNNWKGKINLVIFRNQKPMDLILITK